METFSDLDRLRAEAEERRQALEEQRETLGDRQGHGLTYFFIKNDIFYSSGGLPCPRS